MKRLFSLVAGVLFFFESVGQTTIPQIPASEATSAASMAKWLKAHTTNSTAFQKALFSWIANNIEYDAPNMNRPNSYKDTTAAIARTLQTKLGLCTDYAVLYAQVCKAAGINAIVVTGYTIQEKTMLPIGSHDWIVVPDAGKWTIVDPTWGAGVVENGKFTKRLNWKWFQIYPYEANKTHVPYDPIWQLSTAPMGHDDIVELSKIIRSNKGAVDIASKGKPFAFNDSIRVWMKQTRIQRLRSSASRIRSYGGAANPFIMSELDWMDQTIKVLAANQEVEQDNRQIDAFNAINRDYTEVVKMYNEYVRFKNSQFTPEMADAGIKKMMDGIVAKLGGVKKSLSGMMAIESIKQNANELNDAVVEMDGRVKTEQLFVNKYIKTVKGKRRELFFE
ncbi:hypothetical protein DVR12_16915 [Chitinophaga silvatica]|uniref:Transglutaminase-like domain-containing protein n=1 Tax=Chitinophaga silvatica TaxID=2282649 RepID=A0A3E1Y7I2_9BACT|nr:transglutaminase domain-containing protein [Chitinophaga silvatica]RFS21024.1 hypothetical protein DVR12_16915 [Chitinophaga silvatica]